MFMYHIQPTTYGVIHMTNYPTYKKIKTKPFTVWESMKSRCTSVTAYNYCNYGGKGVLLCDEWDDDFQAFASWYIQQCKELGIDPENNNYQVDKDILCSQLNISPPIYSPKTCKLVTPKENNPVNATPKITNFLAPDKTIISVTNLKDFSYEYDLSYDAIRSVASGRTKTHKGYSLLTS